MEIFLEMVTWIVKKETMYLSVQQRQQIVTTACLVFQVEALCISHNEIKQSCF